MTTLPSPDRHNQYLLPAALALLIFIGCLRIVLDNSKNTRLFFRLAGGGYRVLRRPIRVSKDEIIEKGCDIFDGKWVWDNLSHPLYTEKSCPLLVKQVTCLKNGRPDSYYQNWKWQPDGCNLPRFNALKLLEILRDKRLMLVGDSVQRGMFDSMVCLVQSVIPEGKKSLKRVPPRKIFRAEEYNASIEYYWAPFLVESISDHATNHTVLKRLVRLDSISNHSKQWEGVDFLVFESYVWWMYKPTINATYGNLNNIQEYNVTKAYKIALETWANWIDTSINSHNQKVFFMTMSPTHLWNWEWKTGDGGNCFGETQPIQHPYWGTGSNLDVMGIVKDVLERLRVNVRVLNITQMSEYRKDGHASIYGERKGKLLTKEQRLDPKNYADCIHWCLPGVPDTWNEILYGVLLQDYRKF
ncbi:protein trichome birefringence-like 31 [Bidens hawaiensis]|uniref:protein trichome birefringence-like 31 n=1 Tax=Bidens hawaiensis TaxID=980011 RepID=UPI00404A1230